MHISQCIIASDQFVIRTLQRDITEAVKKELIQLIDVKQCQKVCLTPVDSERQLLKTKPARDDIKNGQFMIINGQHSITASQELQKEGCSEDRREKLQHWDAFIVWSLDHANYKTSQSFTTSPITWTTHSPPRGTRSLLVGTCGRLISVPPMTQARLQEEAMVQYSMSTITR